MKLSHPMLSENEDDKPDESRIMVISFFTINDSMARAFISANVASVIARSGFKVLLLDLDFNLPYLALMLEESNVGLKANGRTLNSWWAGKLDIFEQLLENVLVFEDSMGGALHLLATSRDITQKNEVLTLSEKDQRRSLQRLLVLIQRIKENKLYDFVILNLQDGIDSTTANGIFVSDFSFLVVDHNSLSLQLSAEVIQTLESFHPFLNISGILLHGFKHAALSSLDEEEIIRIESQLQIPVLARCPSIPGLFSSRHRRIELLPGKNISPTHWDYFNGVTASILGYVHSPSERSSFADKRVHSLIVADDAGLPLFTCHFDYRTVRVQDELASAALTSFLAGIGLILREITAQSDITRLIEQQNAKVVIEQDQNIRAFLITAHYSEDIRNKLRMFLKAFVKRFENVLKDWDGRTWAFAGANELVRQVFGLEPLFGP